MGREVRMVPPNWQHPKDALTGRLKPLHDGRGYHEKARAWIVDCVAWENGTHRSLVGHDGNPPSTTKEETPYFWDWDGAPPLEEDYMLIGVPDSERTHFQLYETTSEGTPKGPVFATLDELCEWAANNTTTFASFTATAEEWKRMLSPGSFVHAEVDLPNGGKMMFL